MVIEGGCVSVAMYCLIQFYIQLRGDLAEHSPLLKVIAIKLVIFLSFWQTVSRSDIILLKCPMLICPYSSSYPVSPPLAPSKNPRASKHPTSELAFLLCFFALKWPYLASFIFGHFHGKSTTCGALRLWPQNLPQVFFQTQRRPTVAELLAAELSWTHSTHGTSSKQ